MTDTKEATYDALRQPGLYHWADVICRTELTHTPRHRASTSSNADAADSHFVAPPRIMPDIFRCLRRLGRLLQRFDILIDYAFTSRRRLRRAPSRAAHCHTAKMPQHYFEEASASRWLIRLSKMQNRNYHPPQHTTDQPFITGSSDRYAYWCR
jgi:hypothetical protein